MQKQIRFFQVGFRKYSFLLLLGVAVFGILEHMNILDASATTSTINLQISTNTVSLDVSPDSNSGTFASSSAATISVSTDHFSGYTLGIKADTTGANASKLVNGANTIDSISSALSETNYGDSANTQYNNTWGYKPSKLNSNDNTNYLPAPSVAGETLDVTSSANSNDNDYTIILGVRITPDTPTGTYSNTFVITAVANLLSYSITYNKNTTDAVSNLPAADLGNTNTEYVTLTNDVPTRSGYEFVGWCDDNSSETSCNSILYTPGSNYELDQTADNTNIVLYAIWDEACPANNICYKDNGANSVSSMGNQSATSNTELTLYASNFKNDGYGFAGWSTEPITGWDDRTFVNLYDIFEDNLAAAVSANKVFGPNANYTPGNISTKGQKLYAIWVPVAMGIDHDHHDAHYGLSFQTNDLLNIDVYDASDPENVETLNDKPVGYVTALKDERDNQVYAVAKLADGQFWMIENLRLADKDSSNNDINLTSSNTHNPSLPLTNIYDSSTTSNHLSPTSSLAYDATNAPEGWCTAVSSACYNQSRLRTDNIVLFTNNTSSNYNVSSNVYSYGNYYNWYSATAGRGKYNTDTNNSSVNGDICPAGWRLPKGGNKNNKTNSEYWQIIALLVGAEPANTSSQIQPYYGGIPEGANASSVLRSYPNNFIYSGYASGASTSGRNTVGYYWSSTSGGSDDAYNLSFADADVYPGTNGYGKYLGKNVRCVANL